MAAISPSISDYNETLSDEAKTKKHIQPYNNKLIRHTHETYTYTNKQQHRIATNTNKGLRRDDVRPDVRAVREAGAPAAKHLSLPPKFLPPGWSLFSCVLPCFAAFSSAWGNPGSTLRVREENNSQVQTRAVCNQINEGGVEAQLRKERKGLFGFWTLGSTARLVMHECAVVRNSAVAQGRSSADTANTDKICTRILLLRKGTKGVSTTPSPPIKSFPTKSP